MTLRIIFIFMVLVSSAVYADQIKDTGNGGYLYRTTSSQEVTTKIEDQATESKSVSILNLIRKMDKWIKIYLW